MRLFHPVFNEDGRISLFRVGCLLVAVLCLIAYVLLKREDHQAYEGSVFEESSGSSFSFFKPKPKPEEIAKANREAALAELAQAADFLTQCGTINLGFEGCTFSFSDLVNQSFVPQIAAADDGFAVTLTAKGAQRSDACVTLTVTSQSEIIGFNAAGLKDSQCTLSSQDSELAKVHRITDDLKGNPAPSGRSALVTEVADRKVQKEDRI